MFSDALHQVTLAIRLSVECSGAGSSANQWRDQKPRNVFQTLVETSRAHVYLFVCAVNSPSFGNTSLNVNGGGGVPNSQTRTPRLIPPAQTVYRFMGINAFPKKKVSLVFSLTEGCCIQMRFEAACAPLTAPAI